MNGWIRISPKKSSFRLATLLHCLLGPKLLPPFLIAPKLRHLLYFLSFYLYLYYNYGVHFLFLLGLKLLFIYVGPKQRPPLLWSLLGPKLRPLLFIPVGTKTTASTFISVWHNGQLWTFMRIIICSATFPPLCWGLCLHISQKTFSCSSPACFIFTI